MPKPIDFSDWPWYTVTRRIAPGVLLNLPVTKAIKLCDVLRNERELQRARVIFMQANTFTEAAKTICAELVMPRMDHINAITMQENDAMYIAWYIVHLFVTHEVAE